MKKYAYALLISIILLLGAYLTATTYVQYTYKEPECLDSITITNTRNPNSVNHLGTPIEILCTKWKR